MCVLVLVCVTMDVSMPKETSSLMLVLTFCFVWDSPFVGHCCKHQSSSPMSFWGGPCLHLSFWRHTTEISEALCPLSSTWILEVWTHVLLLAPRTLYSVIHVPVPYSPVLKNKRTDYTVNVCFVFIQRRTEGNWKSGDLSFLWKLFLLEGSDSVSSDNILRCPSMDIFMQQHPQSPRNGLWKFPICSTQEFGAG